MIRRGAARAVVAAALVVACTRKTPAPVAQTTPAADPLASLRTFEEERRHATSFLDQPVQDRAFGADPYALTVLPDGRVAGILRGRDALVILDAELREVARVPAPRSPSAIAATEDGVVVASEVEPLVARFRVQGGTVTRLADIPVDASGVRDIAYANGVIHVIEEHDDRLIELEGIPRSGKPTAFSLPHGPVRLAQTSTTLYVLSLLDHRLSALQVADGRIERAPKMMSTTNDGPYWGLAAAGDIVLAGGVEDHPLDRTGGFFGYVDSFVYGYRNTGHGLERIFALDVSELGLIVPKAISISGSEALITSYGGDHALRIRLDGSVLESFAFPPGTTALVRRPDGIVVGANPLLDAWVTKDRIVKVPDQDGHDTRTERERLGEALFFTGMMAPAGTSEGAKSRFSCETCHFEGYVDGRTHHTGRGDVRATTKPLVGLFNNRPHFSRALDPDLASVAENEFRVAGAPGPANPHFELDSRAVPWLSLAKPHYDADELRIALMSFLMTWTHRTNPRAAVPRAFSAEERHGAEVFRDRCEHCHTARAASDDPASHVDFEEWETRIFHGGPIVWGSDRYEKTGVEPYVHERGARVPSLRRLYKKRPYFTNGSAPDLATALGLTRFRADGFSHAGGDGERLTDTDIGALLVFLDLL